MRNPRRPKFKLSAAQKETITLWGQAAFLLFGTWGTVAVILLCGPE